MDLSTIKAGLATRASAAYAFVSAQATVAYNSALVGTVAKIWETAGPVKYLAPAPALVSAYAGHKLLNHKVSFSKETTAYLLIKGAAATLLIASGMFGAAFAASAFGATGTAFYASGAALPTLVLARRFLSIPSCFRSE